MSTQLAGKAKVSLVEKIASRFSVEPDKLLATLKATAFKQQQGEVSNEQMAALLIVADQYGLNPFTREIYAFPDKKGGIVPVVGVDGWGRIINDHPKSDGLEFNESEKATTPEGGKLCPEWMEVVIHRKDRTHPIIVREYIDEVYRPAFEKDGKRFAGPWQTHTKRMFRHKVLIQGARVAYGFSGIYDEDEAQRIIEGEFNQESAHDKALAFLGNSDTGQPKLKPLPTMLVSEDIQNSCHDAALLLLENGDADGMRKLWKQYDADTHAVLWKMFTSSQRTAMTKLMETK
jgi:phage recombination protein Bet